MNKKTLFYVIFITWLIFEPLSTRAVDMRSQASINFDKTYIPMEEPHKRAHPIIPSGVDPTPVQPISKLPTTGDIAYDQMLLPGILFVLASLYLFNKNKKWRLVL